MSLQNKAVIITGAGGGIGMAAVERFCREGCSVIAADLNLKNAQEAVKGKNAFAIENNVTDFSDCEKVVQECVERFRKVDVLVCNAGISLIGGIHEVPVESFNQVIAVNVLGVYNMIKAALPYISNPGAIVITASKASKRAIPRYTQYVASKHALFGLAQSLAYELGPRGIRVNCICPGDLLDSPMVKSIAEEMGRSFGQTLEEYIKARSAESPLGRYCYYDDVCSAMVYLADNEGASYTTGSNIDVTGGVTVN